MEYAMYAVQTDDGKYTEADTVPDLITGDVDIARHLIMTAIRDGMYSMVDLIISEGDVKICPRCGGGAHLLRPRRA